MLSIGAIGNGNYYLDLARDDYYLKGGEPPGQWQGEGAEALGLAGNVEREAFQAVMKGYGPSGEALIQNAGEKEHQVGWDLTFSAPKSVSTLWASADEATRIAEDSEAEEEKQLRKLDKARLLSKAGRPAAALSLIDAESAPPPWMRTNFLLARVPLLISLDDRATAQEELRRAQGYIAAYHLVYLQPDSEALTLRF